MPDTLTAKDHRELGKQTKDILSALSGGEWVKALDLEVISGSRRVAARIWDAKKRGYLIECRRTKGRVWEYRLLAGQGTLL